MQPVNTKSLFSLLCKTLEKMETNQISNSDAIAISKVVAQANNLLNYELKRAIVMANAETKKTHRNIEIKSFDSIKEPLEGHIVYAEIEANG